MMGPDGKEPFERLRAAREKAGFKSARSAAARFHWAASTYAAHENGSRGFGAEEARSYARAFKASAPWLLTGEGQALSHAAPIVGLAGAGPDGSVLFSVGDGSLGEAPLPVGGNNQTVAVEVRGDSMRGIAEDGWLVYYDDRRNPPTEDLLGEVCVIGLTDGRVLIKKLIRGRRKHHYDLESAAAPTLHDQKVEWAALVTAIIPRSTARRLITRGAA